MSVSNSISTTRRAQTIDALEATTFDCVVIGGGITGAGIAREATLRGLTVALLEATDFASGTSSRSSKLIHGGIRYLASGEVGLVRETALERKEINRLAAHLAERRWMVVPARSRAGMLRLRMGITAYETLGAVEEADRHENWSHDELAEHEPLLNRDRFPYACTYREYLTDDARLVLANLRGAVGSGALALNHVPVDVITKEGGRASGVEARCRFTGRHFCVRSRSVINAAGPWVGAVRRLEDERALPLLQLSKGIHIVFSAADLPVREMLAMRARDGRDIVVVRRESIVYVGTTDTPHDTGSTIWPEITSDDVEYLLEPLPRVLDIEPLKAEHVIAAWAGLRPLIAQPGKKTAEISRRDEILTGPAGVVTIAGGKLTGYRPMARRALEKAFELFERKLPERRQEEPLPGGDFDGDLDRHASELKTALGIPVATGNRLVRLYGAESAAVIAHGATPLIEGSTVLTGEVDWAVCEEGAVTVEDVLYRRIRSALYDPAAREAMIRPVAERMASLLGWRPELVDAEIANVRACFAAELAFAGAKE